jgi:ribosomal protein S18 acetylase RimI-like enzyme
MTVSQRPATPEDEPFLHQLILDTSSEECGAAAWPEPLRTQLLEIQYSARRRSIRARYPGAQDRIVLLDGLPCGWFSLAELPDEIRWIDLMIRPERRGQGAGTALLAEEMAAADRARKPARFSVCVTNAAAIRLYERLGFRRTGGSQTHHFMEYDPRNIDPISS